VCRRFEMLLQSAQGVVSSLRRAAGDPDVPVSNG
jgi:hypothetical protein